MREGGDPSDGAAPERASDWPSDYWPRRDGYWRHGKFVRLVSDEEYPAARLAYEAALQTLAAPELAEAAPVDPLDDPFADVPSNRSFALAAADQLYERAQTARQDFEAHIAAVKPTNAVAMGARKAVRRQIGRIVEQILGVRVQAATLRAMPEDKLDEALSSFWETCNAASAALREVYRMETTLLGATAYDTVDPPNGPPLPPIKDWATVSALVHTDMLSWAALTRGQAGQTMIAKPSPGCGKTRAAILADIQEAANGQRVVFAVKTKEMLNDELASRAKAAAPFVPGTVRKFPLHVIQGRDESTCWNFENVKEVQAHGYAPGTAVCPKCDFYTASERPQNSQQVCPYYRSRIYAQLDTKTASDTRNPASTTARMGASPAPYPLILTTHSSYFSASLNNGGLHGKFWPSDLLILDEDFTDALEPQVMMDQERLEFLVANGSSSTPESLAVLNASKLFLETIKEAEQARIGARSRGYKLADGKAPDPSHSKFGSSFCGNDLHQVFGHVAKKFGMSQPRKIFRDVADAHVQPERGSLFMATPSVRALSALVPPRCLSQVGEALFEERAMRDHIRTLVHKKIYNLDTLSMLSPEHRASKLQDTDEFDAAYRVRLECVEVDVADGKGGTRKEWTWRYTFQDFVSFADQGTRLMILDAYAHVEHYRQLIDKPASRPNDPSYVDPVTVMNHVAKPHPDSRIYRIPLKSTIGHLIEKGGWSQQAAMLVEIAPVYRGGKLLLYAHKKLKSRIEKLFADNNNFGVKEWAFEHYNSGRGKDKYADFDGMIMVSDYVMNFDGLKHIVNARAAAETQRLLARGMTEEAIREATRIRLEIEKADIAHIMANPGTHWRIRQEHQRVNVSEQAQAIHRMRPLRWAKDVTVLGNDIPFTEDIAAATVTIELGGTDTKRYQPATLTYHEALVMMDAIHQHCGVWSPMFYHVFLAQKVAKIYGVSVTSRHTLGEISYKRLSIRDFPEGASACHTTSPKRAPRVPGNAPPPHDPLWDGLDPDAPRVLPLLQRVWYPEAEWQNQNKPAKEMIKAATEQFHGEFSESERGWVYPKWAPPGTRFRWYSRHIQGGALIQEIADCQYGPNVNGKLHVPNTKPFIPF